MYEALLQIGAGGLVVFVVILFLRHLEAQRNGFLTTINNHLSHVEKATDKNTAVLTKIENTIETLTGVLRKNGGS